MEKEKLAPMWQSVLAVIFMLSLIIGVGGWALYSVWNRPASYYEPDIEHR